uniref:Serpentine receptor class gamma n=1 Tax=Parascaris univalens TaxID=6257 RepID=A0A915BUB5_PARUN
MASFNTSLSNNCFSNIPTAAIAQILFAFARIVLLAFIVVLSYTRIPKEHFRTFTLFACTCLLPWDVLLIIWKILAIAKTNGCAVTVYAFVAERLKPFMQLAVTCELQLEMFYTMVTVSLAYLRPVFFQRYFAKRKVFADFIACRIFSLVDASITTLFRTQFSQKVLSTLIKIQSTTDNVLAIISCTFTSAVAITMLKHKTGTNHYAGRRQFLLSFIIYCTPALIMNTPKMLSAIFLYIVKPLVHNWSDFIPPLRALNRFLIFIEQVFCFISFLCFHMAIT